MKLSGILIASVSAQQARQRENKETGFADYSFGGADDAFSSLYDSFGGDDAFGGFDMSAFNDYGFGSTAAPTMAVATDAPDYGFDLGDAFGDASDSDAAADYMNTVASDYDAADDLGSIRPSEDDEVKSNFVVDTGDGNAEFNNQGTISAGTNEVQDQSSFDFQLNNGDMSGAQRCFVGSSGSSNVIEGTDMKNGVVANWFANGVWDVCEGESDTCEIKVVRRKDVIQQIHSKCANRHSCVDNMRQNFNPEAASPGGHADFIFSSWTHQACRPRWNSLGAGTWNARQQQRDSICFFCVEPCRDAAVWGETATSANQMREAECVGRGGSANDGDGASQPVYNASPIPGSDMKLFEDCSNAGLTGTDAANAYRDCDMDVEDDFGQTVWADTGNPNNEGTGPDMRKLNFYSVIDNVMLYNTEANSNHPLSLMQDVSQIQYAQINARDSFDFMTDAVDPNNPVRFSFSDNSALTQSDRNNLAKLFDDDASTEYSRVSVAAANGEFQVEIEFVEDVTFNTLTLAKGGGPVNFDRTYKNTCLTLFEDDGTTQVAQVCADDADGDGIDPQDETDANIVFDATGSAAVRFARLSFDTDAASGNNGATVNVKGLSMDFAV